MKRTVIVTVRKTYAYERDFEVAYDPDDDTTLEDAALDAAYAHDWSKEPAEDSNTEIVDYVFGDKDEGDE